MKTTFRSPSLSFWWRMTSFSVYIHLTKKIKSFLKLGLWLPIENIKKIVLPQFHDIFLCPVYRKRGVCWRDLWTNNSPKIMMHDDNDEQPNWCKLYVTQPNWWWIIHKYMYMLLAFMYLLTDSIILQLYQSKQWRWQFTWFLSAFYFSRYLSMIACSGVNVFALI